MEVQRSIIDLPLHVLEMVFQLLNHSNKLHLAQSDRVLAEAYASHTRSIYKRMHLSYVLERRIPWADVLAICGANVVEIVNQHALADYQLKIIQLHCPNLQVVNFEIKDENCAGLKSLLESLKQQATVRLRIDDRATLKIYNMLQQLPRLDRLSLEKFVGSDASQIHKLVDLEELHISNIYGSYWELDIFKLCFHLPKLRWLKLVHIELLHRDESPELSFSVLEKLKIIGCALTWDWPYGLKDGFLRLKDVTIRGSDFRHFQPCKWFSKYSPALENLKLFQAHPDRNDFLDMLRGCKKLRFLVIELKNLQITKELLATITGILKENGVTPDQPLQFKVNVHKKVKNVKLKHLMAETPNADLLHLC
ncbi:uncharacterized protein DMAD_05958 [Drosophila madeirensis]|uniref:F-box domain-containing protein n=1 Tax=Drosophila madeirensis TaxID=30013 RepID=A0AAU9FPM0_DROMD